MSDVYEGFVRPSAGVTDTPVAAVRKDKAAVFVATNNTYQPMMLDSGGSLRVTEEGGKATYYGVSAFSCDSTATDIAIFPGITTAVMKILWIEVYTAATATADGIIKIVRRSAANTAGTLVSSSVTKADTGNAAAGGQPQHYTAHPTGLGTGVDLWAKRAGQQALGAVGGCIPYFFDFRQRHGAQGLRLNNIVTDIIAVNAAAALGGSGNVWTITWAWVEEPTTA